MRYWRFIQNKAGDVELRIMGEIIDDDLAWIYEWWDIPYSSPNTFRQALAEHKGSNITVWIDSRGGDVFAAVGIYSALKEHSGTVTVKIDGKAYSAASIIAMAGKDVLMSPGSMMLVHNPWTETGGEAKDLRHVADILDEVKEAIMNVYELKTGRTREEISAIMDEETPMSAATAIDEKFADGMLYAETAAAVKDYYFNTYRPVILNGWNSSINRALEIKQKQQERQEPAPAGPTKAAKPKEPKNINNHEEPEKTPTITGRVFDKRVKVREILHRRYQTHG